MTRARKYHTRNAVKKAFVSTANIVNSPREKKVYVHYFLRPEAELIIAYEAEQEIDRGCYGRQ
jgi:hypothetical protein